MTIAIVLDSVISLAIAFAIASAIAFAIVMTMAMAFAFAFVFAFAFGGLSPKLRSCMVGLPTIVLCDPWMSHLMYAKAVQRLNQ